MGTGMRYGLALLAARVEAEHAFWPPAGTFAANVIGSFLLGVIFVALEGRQLFAHDARLVIGVGVMGGFTTYSSFNLETLRLIENLEYGRAAAYMALTMLVCLAAGSAGLWVGRFFR